MHLYTSIYISIYIYKIQRLIFNGRHNSDNVQCNLNESLHIGKLFCIFLAATAQQFTSSLTRF